jgi:SAM-dependent methyltransferase
MSRKFVYPDFVARFYDLIYNKIRSGIDTEYFVNEALSAEGKVLEIGVGTGRLFIEALEKGADMYGIDISRSMIEVLTTRLDPKEHYRIKVGDAVNMKLDKKFNLIIAPFRVFSHILETKNRIAFLNNVYEHLNDGGRFIFDLFIPDAKILATGIDNLTDFEGEYEPGKKFRRTVSSTADIINQLLDITMKFEWDEDGRKIMKEWKLKMRFFFRYELEHLVSMSKLTLDNISGDYQGSPLNDDSKEFIITCRKD